MKSLIAEFKTNDKMHISDALMAIAEALLKEGCKESIEYDNDSFLCDRIQLNLPNMLINIYWENDKIWQESKIVNTSIMEQFMYADIAIKCISNYECEQLISYFEEYEINFDKDNLFVSKNEEYFFVCGGKLCLEDNYLTPPFTWVAFDSLFQSQSI